MKKTAIVAISVLLATAAIAYEIHPTGYWHGIGVRIPPCLREFRAQSCIHQARCEPHPGLTKTAWLRSGPRRVGTVLLSAVPQWSPE